MRDENVLDFPMKTERRKFGGVNRWHVLLAMFAAGAAWGAVQLQVISNRDEITKTRAEFKHELTQSRTEIRADIQNFRQEARQDLQEIRALLRKGPP